ncbi:TPA: hypothetical protein N0F65_011687 [Lagenidium giganteum]|uniref:HORMA domain-containing protein n=1 Tax=Lagenidium giganteum TaxID=4803 RepID=A0AAV2Z0E7_9STRA|nr:TPA: hypothetical protein N0F65_011687 [Lagenidium giganteum]
MGTSKPKQNDKELVVDLVLEFVEAALHEYLFAWNVYPSEAFELRTIYELPVHMCRHPQLCDYIHTMLVGCRDWLLRGELDKLHVPVLSALGHPIDSLVIETAWVHDATHTDEPLPLSHLEDEFRAALVALAAAPFARAKGTSGEPEPAAQSFRILAHTVEGAPRPGTAVDQRHLANSWVLADSHWSSVMDGEELNDLFPVRSIASEQLPVRVLLYMERRHGDDHEEETKS